MKTAVHLIGLCLLMCSSAEGELLTSNAHANRILVSTNFQGLELMWSLARTQFYSGAEIRMAMTVSNATAAGREFRYEAGRKDTSIGDAAITDALTGLPVESLILPRDRFGYSQRRRPLSKGDEFGYDCDLTKLYGLTNAGTYFIQVKSWFPPSNCPPGAYCPEVRVSTPALAITILEATNKPASNPLPTVPPPVNEQGVNPAKANETRRWPWLLGVCSAVLAVILVRARFRSR